METEVVVLHVDDEPGLSELVADFLERENSDFVVKTAQSADEGLDVLNETQVDCIVSDYDMPRTDGLEFLEAVREKYSTLPFILYTGKGSEEIASKAISAGVSEYLEKQRGNSQYTVLANRIENLVNKHRAEKRATQAFSAVDTAHEGIALLNETGEFIYANQAYTDIVGYSRDELLGEHWEILYPSDAVEQVREEVLPNVPEDGYLSEERVWVRKNGERIVTDHSLSYSSDNTLVCVARDSQVKSFPSSDAINEKQFLETTINALNDIFYVVDADGRLIRWNDKLPEVTGYTEAEIKSMDLLELFACEDRQKIAEAIEDGMNGDTEDTRATIETKYGCHIPYDFQSRKITDANGETIAICGVGRDVSDFKELQTELNESEAALSELYRISTSADITFEEKVTEILHLGCDRLGLDYATFTTIEDNTQSIEQSVGGHPDLQPGEQCQLENAYCRKTIKADGILTVEDAPAEGWKGDPAYEQFEIDAYLGGKIEVDGELYGTLCFTAAESRQKSFTDAEKTFVELLTRWISYELKQRKDVDKLEDKTDELKTLASVISHDLRNPLSVIEGHLDLAKDTGDMSHVDAAAEATERMEDLVEDILALTRSGDDIAETDQVSLPDVAREAWEFSTGESTTLTVEDQAKIKADRSRLLQMFENLFNNAEDHGGNDVTVQVGVLDEGTGFYVEDDGVGIPEEERSEVFESGYSPNGGTGLGLSIVSTISDGHDWTVTVTDSEEGGARFEFTGVATARPAPAIS